MSFMRKIWTQTDTGIELKEASISGVWMEEMAEFTWTHCVPVSNLIG